MRSSTSAAPRCSAHPVPSTATTALSLSSRRRPTSTKTRCSGSSATRRHVPPLTNVRLLQAVQPCQQRPRLVQQRLPLVPPLDTPTLPGSLEVSLTPRLPPCTAHAPEDVPAVDQFTALPLLSPSTGIMLPPLDPFQTTPLACQPAMSIRDCSLGRPRPANWHECNYSWKLLPTPTGHN